MKKLFVIFILTILWVTTDAHNYYTAQDGDMAVLSTWLPGNIPSIPNFSDTSNHIYINHKLTSSSSGQYYIKCYVKIEMGGKLTMSSALHVSGPNAYIAVWGSFIINNVLYTESGSVIEIFYGGYVFANNKIDIGGQGNGNPGHIILHGGEVCWDNLWKGNYPPEGYGVLCESPNPSQAGCCSSVGPLGITLVYFNAICNGRFSELSWITENEENNDHFTIERSRDLFYWEKVAKVPGSINSTGRLEYKIYDELPYNGINYYRLSQTDTDGTLTVFDHQWLRYTNCKFEEVSTLYPVPANDYIIFNNVNSNNFTYKICDLWGNTVGNGSLVPGENKVHVHGLHKGIYYFRTQYGDNHKIIKD